MRIHNIYADENGETHFLDIEIELSDAGPDGITSKRFPASGIIFRTTPADWFFDWHPATRRQYVINLDAPHKVTASDGETRIIGVGEIFLIEPWSFDWGLSGQNRPPVDGTTTCRIDRFDIHSN